jgi:hypothetical protein
LIDEEYLGDDHLDMWARACAVLRNFLLVRHEDLTDETISAPAGRF